MRVIGIDFTSSPRRQKPITALNCRLEHDVLYTEFLEEWHTFEQFEKALRRPGPWIAGIDFPFGQSRTFISNIGWPSVWHAYVRHARFLGRPTFCETLNEYRRPRIKGDKEHRRQTDMSAGSISPQKLYGVPVGLMFFEGAPRLIDSGVMIPHLKAGDQKRVVVEAYPGCLARRLIGRRTYKQDTKKKRTADHYNARCDILEFICNGIVEPSFELRVVNELDLVTDPTGDRLDSFLCALQAAWAWSKRDAGFGAPSNIDTLEGWIADPRLCRP